MLYVQAYTIVTHFSRIVQKDLVVFRGNYKFENRAESTTLSFKNFYLVRSQRFCPMSGL